MFKADSESELLEYCDSEGVKASEPSSSDVGSFVFVASLDSLDTEIYEHQS